MFVSSIIYVHIFPILVRAVPFKSGQGTGKYENMEKTIRHCRLSEIRGHELSKCPVKSCIKCDQMSGEAQKVFGKPATLQLFV